MAGSILVTGGAGYIGSHAVYALRDAGYRVLVIDDLSTGDARALPDDIELITGCVSDKALVQGVMRTGEVSAIFHFAAKAVVPDSIRSPLEYYRSNVASSLSLIDTAIQNNVNRFIFSSTAAVYGAVGEGPVAEDAPVRPLTPYGASKAMVERMLLDCNKAHRLQVGILRYFNVAGADPQGRTGQSTPGATHLIKMACQAALGRRAALEIYGTDYPTRDGTGVRDYIHVCDLVDAHVQLHERLSETQSPMVLNCGYGQGYSVLEVVKAVERVSGRPVPHVFKGRRQGDAAEVVAANAQIKATLDWRPRFDNIDLTVSHALDWERNLADERVLCEA